MELEELEDAEDDVVDVAEAGGLALLGVMKTAGPVDGDVGVAAVDLDGGADGTAGGGLAELEEAIEDGAVLANVEALEEARVGGGGVGGRAGEGGEEVDVVIGVEAADVVGGGGEGAADLHEAVEGIVDDQVVGHPDAVGLHRVPLAVVVVPDARLVEVGHPPLLRVRTRRRRQRRPLPLPKRPAGSGHGHGHRHGHGLLSQSSFSLSLSLRQWKERRPRQRCWLARTRI